MTDVYERIKNILHEVDLALLKKESRANVKDTLVVGLVSISRQHYYSIIELTKDGFSHYSSALALLRPLVDSVYRAIWLMKVATDNQANRINQGKSTFDSTQVISKKIDNKFNSEKEIRNSEVFNVFHNRYLKYSPTLHGLTHSGMELINKQLKDGKIHPVFTDDELVALMDEAKIYYCLLLLVYGDFNENEELLLVAYKLSDLKLSDIKNK